MFGVPGLAEKSSHLVVEQEAEPRHRHATAVAAVDGVSEGDRVAFLVDD